MTAIDALNAYLSDPAAKLSWLAYCAMPEIQADFPNYTASAVLEDPEIVWADARGVLFANGTGLECAHPWMFGVSKKERHADNWMIRCDAEHAVRLGLPVDVPVPVWTPWDKKLPIVQDGWMEWVEALQASMRYRKGSYRYIKYRCANGDVHGNCWCHESCNMQPVENGFYDGLAFLPDIVFEVPEKWRDPEHSDQVRVQSADGRYEMTALVQWTHGSPSHVCFHNGPKRQLPQPVREWIQQHIDAQEERYQAHRRQQDEKHRERLKALFKV